MSFESKDYLIDSNGGELLEVKKKLWGLEKEIIPNLSNVKKIASAMLATTMLSATNIDTSKLPHYASNLWKYVHIKVEKVNPKTVDDYDATFNTDYYEKYNPKAHKLEHSHYSENINLVSHIVWWNMNFYGHNYKLAYQKNVYPSKSFLKNENLDEVAININWRTYIAKPKFLQLDFEIIWKKGYMVYGMWKSMALVYVPVKTKIVVLWSVVDWEFYEEEKHKIYDISATREKYEKQLNTILKLLWCNYSNCGISKDSEGNRYFYKNHKLVWKVETFWDKKLIIKWNKIVWKILEKWNKVYIIDNHDNIISSFSWYKKVYIKLNQTDMNIKLFLKLKLTWLIN